jgi:uncharacterized protein YqjF (DUF2071 family)
VSTAKPGIFLTAEWRHLLMLNYEVDPAVLAPLVPAGTLPDTHDGRTWMSMVGFRFLDTRVLGIPVPFHRDFVEFNLRFYVRREVNGEVRRAVVFVRELVPRAAIAWIARLAYNEPYTALPMRSTITPGPPLRAQYDWRLSGKWNSCGGTAAGWFDLPAEGSLEAFITEHYWGYTRQRDGSTVEYEVEHPRWGVSAATDVVVDADLEALYGRQLAGFLSRPASAFQADGSGVSVRRAVSLPRS